jgi:hypothetical protein
MRTLVAQPEAEQLKAKSFDVLASVDMLRFDLETGGNIRCETMERVYDEELSFLAEGINRPLYTEFVLRSVNGKLSYFDHGQWRPYRAMLLHGFETAAHEAKIDPRKEYLAKRAYQDLQVGDRLAALKPGEQFAWCSTFPEEACALYGESFVAEAGFRPKRRMGFLYLAERSAGGSLTLRTQSVDASDPEAFVNALMIANADPASDIETMREAYDDVLMQKYGGIFHAGRRPSRDVPEENAWAVVERHKDVIEYYFHEIEKLAGVTAGSRAELERTKKRLTYGVWSLIKKRLDEQAAGNHHYGNQSLIPAQYNEVWMREQVEQAYAATAKRGEMLFGCGGTLRGEEAILNASTEDVFDSIFGAKSDFGKMHCPFCKAEQWGDKCSPNQHCTKCNARVVGGKVVSKGNGGKKRLRLQASRPNSLQRNLAKKLIIKADDRLTNKSRN